MQNIVYCEMYLTYLTQLFTYLTQIFDPVLRNENHIILIHKSKAQIPNYMYFSAATKDF